MGVIPLLVVCSVAVAGLFLGAFLWANREGQYDDLQTPAIRVLFEDRHIGNDA
jgi:cbb3-type cytochrome oxidase maturation protein